MVYYIGEIKNLKDQIKEEKPEVEIKLPENNEIEEYKKKIEELSKNNEDNNNTIKDLENKNLENNNKIKDRKLESLR